MQASHVQVRPAGSAAVLLDCGDLEGALGVFAKLASARERGELTVDELIPAAETVLVSGGEARDARSLTPKLRSIIAGSEAAAGQGLGIAETVIPVHYRGEDLAEVAALTGMSIDEVIARHIAAEYTVAFTGFAPGFAYLSGGDPRLEVPRRATPRPRLVAGSVGLAGKFSGVYPRESPGGWQIIGFTDHKMWDLEREQPAALLAGGKVRFAPAREEAVVGSPTQAGAAERAAGARATQPPVARILDAGLQTLIEDEGRRGTADMGVGAAGAATPRAYRRANRLVGNTPGAAALELGHGGFALEALGTVVLAITGAERSGTISGPLGTRAAPSEVAFRLNEGETLRLGAPIRGLRTVIALRGGVDAPITLGSRSRDTLAGLGPAPLQAGDDLFVADQGALSVGAPEPADQMLPANGEETVLRVIRGPRDDWFDTATMARLTSERWEVSPRSDRVGVRLQGEALTRVPDKVGSELASEGMVLGALQVPPDGQPVLFLADRPLTGGYPVIAVVHGDDIDLAAQLAPGATVRFVIAEHAGHASGGDASAGSASGGDAPGDSAPSTPFFSSSTAAYTDAHTEA